MVYAPLVLSYLITLLSFVIGDTISVEIFIKSTDGPISKYVNRRVSTRITKLILKSNLPITPNQVSVASFILSVLSAISFTIGLPAIGGVVAEISSIVDGVDGELARAKKMESKFGSFLDSMLDRLADILIVASASISSSEYLPEPFDNVVPTLAISGALLVSYLHIRSQFDLGIHPMALRPSLSIASRDVRIFLLMIGGVLEQVVRGALAYSVVLLACVCYLYVITKLLQVASLARYKAANYTRSTS
ncbi:MAG: CDP-alcohol phosphatidyltransferase family protein [Sulfolobales archaeon]